MEFASTHILNYDESDEEDVRDGELEETYAVYQGLSFSSVNNVTYGDVIPKILTGPPKPLRQRPRPMPRKNAPKPKRQAPLPPVADRAIYDNAGMKPSSNKDDSSDKQHIYDNPVPKTRKQENIQKKVYDNPTMPKGLTVASGQKSGDKAQIYDNAIFQPPPTSPKNKGVDVSGVSVVYNNPRVPDRKAKNAPPNRPLPGKPSVSQYDQAPHAYAVLQEGASEELLPPPLPPFRKAATEPLDEGEYTYVALNKTATKKIRRADTNIVAVKFDMMVEPKYLHAGQPVVCQNCAAILSYLSKVESNTRGKIWECEYCGIENQVAVGKGQVPDRDDLTFVLRPGSESGDDTLVIFCIDISGSMSVTTEVPSNQAVQMRQNTQSAVLQAYREELDMGSNVYGAVGSATTTHHISRLQSMQSAIEQQIAKLEREHPNKRVGIVAFNDQVTVIGDGMSEPIPLEGAGLTDFHSLVSLASSLPISIPVAEVRSCICDKIYSLSEGGQTALGPALLVSVSMAAHKPGSKVIICTDGLSNIGLGCLQEVDDAQYGESVNFFDNVGDFARDKGVCVSVLTIEGENCRVIELGNVADKTGGKVNIVNPFKLNENFENILEDTIIATGVTAKMILHRGLYFREEGTECSQVDRNMGNIRENSEATFEFGVRKVRHKEVLYDNRGGTTFLQNEDAGAENIYDSVSPKQSMIDGLEQLPFQMQVKYTGRDGGEYIRVLTMQKPVTKDRQFVEQNANIAILGVHAVQNAAKLAVEGNYGEAQLKAFVTQRLVERHAQQIVDGEGIYGEYMANVAPIHAEISRAQQKEVSQVGQNLSDIEEEEATPMNPPSGKEGKKRILSKKMKHRRKNVSDRAASVFYKMKASTSSSFAMAL